MKVLAPRPEFDAEVSQGRTGSGGAGRGALTLQDVL